uniref:Uncharacterized protein n=1 Tax=Oryza nivara TaxID=4536 RepID=A0A0E0GHV1_ORYNI
MFIHKKKARCGPSIHRTAGDTGDCQGSSASGGAGRGAGLLARDEAERAVAAKRGRRGPTVQAAAARGRRHNQGFRDHEGFTLGNKALIRSMDIKVYPRFKFWPSSRASNIDNEMPITFNMIDFSPEKKTLTDRTNFDNGIMYGF